MCFARVYLFVKYIENLRLWSDYGQRFDLEAPDTGARNWDSWIGPLSARNFDRESPSCFKLKILNTGWIKKLAIGGNFNEYIRQNHLCSEIFPKSSLMSKSDHKHSRYRRKQFIFLREGPGLGQDPRLLGYGFKIPDRTINV
jgi:hypothetical protein